VRKKKTVIKAAQAAPAKRAPLRLIVGIILLFVGIAAWKTVATRSPDANSIVAAATPVPLPPRTNFIPVHELSSWATTARHKATLMSFPVMEDRE
jgi:hypothetical protein